MYNIHLPEPLHQWEGAGEFAASLQADGGRVVRALHHAAWVTVELPDRLGDAGPRVRRCPGVLSMERDTLCSNCQPTAREAAHVGVSRTTWAAEMVGAPEAHRVTRGVGARVVVIDTGLTPHEELRDASIGVVESWVPQEGPQDQHGHGTAITGIVVAQGRQLLGLAPAAHVMMLKALGRDGEGMWSWVAAAVDRAIDLQADVVVMALGGDDESAMLEDALASLALSGAVSIAPAGNSGAGRLDFPARTGLPLVATAVDRDGERAPWANWGPWPASPDVAAPGVTVPVLARDGGYDVMSGTSMATGVVGACWSLVYAAFPGLRGALAHALALDPKEGGEMPSSVAEARQRLAATSSPLGGRDYMGYGLIDAAALVEMRARVRQVAGSLAVPLVVAAAALLAPLVLRRRTRGG